MSNIVVGIDLGTTNSLVGYVLDGAPRLADDGKGDALLPSAVGVDASGALLVGRAARNRRLLDPEGTATSVKRRMGQDVKVRIGTREMSPPQVSALILGALLDRVERETGERPARAVITVPAYFDDAQREATRNAGLLAGLDVERLINEPTAAAMTVHTGQEQRVLVYDLGGGTFDVSILDRDEGFLEVRASRGDTHLGGDDIDAALVRHVLAGIDGDRETIANDPRAMTRLLEAVERAKIALSDREEVRLHEPFLAGKGETAVHLDTSLLRQDVESVARPFIERTLVCIDDALRDAGVKADQLDRVVMVGGASKMPLVARMVGERLGRPVFVDPDADTAVALGASIVAARAAGLPVDEVLVDITPHSLSVGVLDLNHDYDGDTADLVASRVIERNTVVPVERARTYFTAVEDQASIEVPIVQGEGEYVGDNTKLGTVRVEALPPSPAASPVEIKFRLDLSGLLHIAATHLPSGRSAEVTIANSPYRLTEVKREAAKKEVDALRVLKPAQGASDSDLSLARAMLARADKAMASGSGDALRAVQAAREALQQAIDDADVTVAEKMDALSDALLDLM